jgi:hypothetical protein
MPAQRSFRITARLLTAAVLFAVASSVSAATYVVPSDRDTVRRADAIVIASALSSYPEEASDGSIETITLVSIEEVIKGSISGETLQIHEPGGRLGKKMRIVGGAPVFKEGERLLLFLKEYQPGKYASSDFVLGKFSFATDEVGEKLLVRQEGDVTGWDPDLKEHHEIRRNAAKFLEFVRAEARGIESKTEYTVATHTLKAGTTALTPKTNVASTSPKSYTFDDPTNGWRWFVFPSAVTYKTYQTTINPTAAVNAVNAAFAAWNGDTLSNVNLVNGGADSGPGTPGGIAGASDSRNTIRFEIDLEHSVSGAGPFACNGGNYSGLLGLGGISAAINPQVGPAGETFWTIVEGDADMNTNVLGCTALITSGDLNSAVTHEVGHSIGFRHADQNRNNSVCTPSVTNECSSSAIMKSFIPTGLNAALQTWDQNAVRAVYPLAATPPPAAPSITATATSTTSVSVTWAAVATATSYDVYRKIAGGSLVFIANTLTPGYTDGGRTANNSYLYKVVAKNAGGDSPDSNKDLATTILFTDDPLVAGAAGTKIKAVHLTELRTAVNAVRLLAGVGTFSFTDPVLTNVNVKSVHVTQLRTNLDTALTALTLPTSAYTNSAAASTVVKAVDFQEIRTRVK